MPYVPVPKDLTKVKTKVAFNLTKRQIICFSLGGVIGLPVYFLSRNVIGNTAAVLIMIVLMLPFFFLAMYERNGQPLEVVLRHFITAQYKRPKIRKFQTENTFRKEKAHVRKKEETRRGPKHRAADHSL